MNRPILNVADAAVTRELTHGKRALPLHCHHANEEMFYVIEGTGTLRFGKDEYPVRAGDVVACPPGGPEVAHQFIIPPKASFPGRYVAEGASLDYWQGE